ncbi:alpha/beta hydrolase [Streptomyces sp. NPDC006984]|uniref:alpha/beta fold hydrolase n=1 Tax=Streptomyces sp. NPDC006984 TaxID=3155463 RepID=UPI0033E456C8
MVQVEEKVALVQIEAPCLVVSGAHDMADFREIAARLPDQMPHAKHVELPWAGHLPSRERPAKVVELLKGFLGRALSTG